MTRKHLFLVIPAFAALGYWLVALAIWSEAGPLGTFFQPALELTVLLGVAPVLVGVSVAVRRSSIAEMERQASIDGLTGLPNKAYFMRELEQAGARASRHRQQVAVLFLDLDRFKLFNDSMGHAAGDSIIAQVAERVGREVRHGEVFARVGGDEFTILLEGVSSIEGAEVAARRFLRCLDSPFLIDGRAVTVTCSIGIAINESLQVSPEELVKRADVALYEAKAAGRACYRSFSAADSALREGGSKFDAELRTALDRGEMSLVFQPMVRLSDGETFGFEALIRWSSGHGLLLPEEFIHEAEELGLLSSIGRWVLKDACLEATKWPRHSLSGVSPSISINVAAKEFRQRELVSEVRAVLQETKLEPGRLILEVVEGALLEEHDGALEKLQALQSLGVRIAIDDFGAGYSPLGYLRDFPIDIFKIDRSLIANLGETSSTAIVSSIVALAHGLGGSVVAEGVENPKQLSMLKEARCDLAQGFVLAHPMPANALTSFLGSRHAAMIAENAA